MKRLWALLLCCLCLGGCASLPGEERSFALCLGVHASTSGVEDVYKRQGWSSAPAHSP